MKRNNTSKILLIILFVIIGLVLLGIEKYKYMQTKKHTELIVTANKYMYDGEYDKAIAILEQSLKEKYDSNIKNGIDFANKLKKLKGIYDEGTKFLNEKKYLEAMNQFQKISNDDKTLYDDAQSKIEECKKQYIEQSKASNQ